jgi:hypothetical protein
VVLGILVHVRETVRRITGQRAHKIAQAPDEEGDAKKHGSVSPVSFNEQVEHLKRLIALVRSQPAYVPAKEDISVEGLRWTLEEMMEANAEAMAAEWPLAEAHRERNRLLYEPGSGMTHTALRVKAYVKAVFGVSSPQYREVRPMTFSIERSKLIFIFCFSIVSGGLFRMSPQCRVIALCGDIVLLWREIMTRSWRPASLHRFPS